MKKTLLISLLLCCSLGLAACDFKNPTSSNSKLSPSPAAQKQGETTKTGIISQNSGKYYLQVNGAVEEIDSYSLDFSQYVGKQVTVSGQYSGDTLFVSQIK